MNSNQNDLHVEYFGVMVVPTEHFHLFICIFIFSKIKYTNKANVSKTCVHRVYGLQTPVHLLLYRFIMFPERIEIEATALRALPFHLGCFYRRVNFGV